MQDKKNSRTRNLRNRESSEIGDLIYYRKESVKQENTWSNLERECWQQIRRDRIKLEEQCLGSCNQARVNEALNKISICNWRWTE